MPEEFPFVVKKKAGRLFNAGIGDFFATMRLVLKQGNAGSDCRDADRVLAAAMARAWSLASMVCLTDQSGRVLCKEVSQMCGANNACVLFVTIWPGNFAVNMMENCLSTYSFVLADVKKTKSTTLEGAVQAQIQFLRASKGSWRGVRVGRRTTGTPWDCCRNVKIIEGRRALRRKTAVKTHHSDLKTKYI